MRLPDIVIPENSEVLAELPQRLDKLGYQEQALAELFGRWDISELVGEEYAAYVWKARNSNSELGRAAGFFLLGQKVSSEKLQEWLDSPLIAALEEAQVFLRWQDSYICQAVIYPCLGRYIVTDYWVSRTRQKPGKVYELGTDSYVLARVTSRRDGKRALDLCTGSGVHAVMSGGDDRESTAVDINPRALHYTKLNAKINAVECRALFGDLYQPVEEEVFDLITANPPFVPSPDPDVLIHRSAGETGEEIPQRLVAGLPTHLAEGGLFSMILEHPVYADDAYLDRLERWLGESKGWGIAVLTFNQAPPVEYALGHMAGVEDKDQAMASYLESYARHGIVAINFAQVFICRLNAEQENWKFQQLAQRPNVDIVADIEEWLDNLKIYQNPDWEPDPVWKPKLSKNYVSLWRNWDNTQGILEAAEPAWLQGTPLNPDEAELMSRMKGGTKTVQDLKGEWLADSLDEDRFMSSLRSLGLRRALV